MNTKGQTTLEYILVTIFVVMGIIYAFWSADLQGAVCNTASGIQNSMLVEE